MKQLPTTGSSELLERLSPFIPDDLINSLLETHSGPGRPPRFSAAQLFRAHLLALLTPVHSFNLLVELLPEQRSWRSFARLRNCFSVPDVRMLHEFRAHLDLWKLRRVNEQLLGPLLQEGSKFPKTVALIDSTDLPASTNGYKKNLAARIMRGGQRLAVAVARMASRGTSLVTRSTRYACGCDSTMRPFCWFLWCRGQPPPIGTM